MIKKLKNKITLIIIIAITIPFLLIVTFYTYSYYDNIIKVNTRFIDRFFGEPNNKKNEISKTTSIDGIYNVLIQNNQIINSSDNVTEEIEEYALKIAKKKKEIGIIGNYIYKVRIPDKIEKETSIILIESSNEIDKIHLMIIYTLILSGVGILLIILLSKKLATIIVKPVEESFQKQKNFISDASHELKTPLAVIQANADVLEGEIGKNKWLSYIQNETENMSKLVNELLYLTRIENIEELRVKEKFNLSEHIELISSSFESMAYEKNVKLETNIEKDIILDCFNKSDLTHILSTLIDNAIKHTEEKKKVIINFSKIKDKILIEVKNKGEEIPLEERDKIFDRFYRIDKSRNRNEKRYGLGLSIAKSTILKNNGNITVDYKDGYTIFKVELPIKK